MGLGYVVREGGKLHFEYRVPAPVFDAIHDIVKRNDPNADRADAICYRDVGGFIADMMDGQRSGNPAYKSAFKDLEAEHQRDLDILRKRYAKGLNKPFRSPGWVDWYELTDMPVCLSTSEPRRGSRMEFLQDIDSQHHERFHAWCIKHKLVGTYMKLSKALEDYVNPLSGRIMDAQTFEHMMELAEEYGVSDQVVEEIFARIAGARYAARMAVKRKWIKEDGVLDAVHVIVGSQWGRPLALLAEHVTRSGEPTAVVYQRIVEAAARRGRRVA